MFLFASFDCRILSIFGLIFCFLSLFSFLEFPFFFGTCNNSTAFSSLFCVNLSLPHHLGLLCLTRGDIQSVLLDLIFFVFVSFSLFLCAISLFWLFFFFYDRGSPPLHFIFIFYLGQRISHLFVLCFSLLFLFFLLFFSSVILKSLLLGYNPHLLSVFVCDPVSRSLLSFLCLVLFEIGSALFFYFLLFFLSFFLS